MDPKHRTPALLAPSRAPAPSLRAPAPSATTPLRCPAPLDPLSPRITDHVVPLETPQELVRGRLIAMPCAPGHGDPHCRLDFLLSAHVRPGFVASTDLLTRWSRDSNFASDTCIRQEGDNPLTSERYLEEIAFEIVNTQAPSEVRERAEDMARLGVRRIFALFVKRKEVAEWRDDAFVPLPLSAAIEDERCLVRPLPVQALLDRAVANDAAAQALIDQRVPALEAYHQDGVMAGQAQGQRLALQQILKARGIALPAEIAARIEATSDTVQIQRWIVQAATATSLRDIF